MRCKCLIQQAKLMLGKVDASHYPGSDETHEIADGANHGRPPFERKEAWSIFANGEVSAMGTAIVA